MKRLLVLLLPLCLSFGALDAQVKVYAGLGFNQSFTQIDSLDFIFDNYNSRNGLENGLKPVSSPRGVAVQTGLVFGRFVLDLGYTGRSQVRKSEETVLGNGTTQVREIRFRANTFDIGAAGKLNQSEDWLLSLGASIDFGAVRVFSRYGNSADYRQIPLRSPVMNEVTVGSTIFMHASFPVSPDLPLHIFIRPYFQYDLYANEYNPVNRSINFQTYLNDPPFLVSRSSNFGIKVGVMFYGG